uniref:RRM domain-containing protein n=1 Tax=Rhizophora mucronata TaxID=61149 RepID=A0A2P2JPB4_RHIMU
MTSRAGPGLGGGGGGGRDRLRREFPYSRFDDDDSNANINSNSNISNRRGNNPPSRHLWVGNLSHSIVEADLTDYLLRFGELESVAFQPGRSYAFINFKMPEDAIAAMKALQGFPLAGNPLRIEFAKAVSYAPPKPFCLLLLTISQLPCICCVWIYVYYIFLEFNSIDWLHGCSFCFISPIAKGK